MAKQLMRLVAISMFLACAGIPARATILQQLTLDEWPEVDFDCPRRVTGSSEVVRGGDVFTLYKFQILESLKSGRRGPGSSCAGRGCGRNAAGGSGGSNLRAGREYVLFLWTSRSGLTQLIGMSQGLFSVEHSAIIDPRASRAGSGEQMLDAAGHAVREETLSMPLTELRPRSLKRYPFR